MKYACLHFSIGKFSEKEKKRNTNQFYLSSFNCMCRIDIKNLVESERKFHSFFDQKPSINEIELERKGTSSNEK